MANCVRCGRQLPALSFGKKICRWCVQHEAAQRGEDVPYQRVEAAPTRSDENARLRPERSALREGYSDDDGRRFLSTGSVLAGAHSAAAISEAASAYKPSPCRFPTGTGSELRIRTVSALSTDLGQRISPTKSLTFTTDVSAETSNAWSRSRDASGSRHVPRGTSTTLR